MQALKPATAIGQMGASVPPATAISMSPRRIISLAMPMASAPLEQGRDRAVVGAFEPEED